MGSREYIPAGGWSLAASLHLFSLLLTTLISFWSGIFCCIMQTSFWLFHLKKFDLNLFCSYCFCFLLFTKFLTLLGFLLFFYGRTCSVCCSLQSHASLSWVLEPSYNFKLYPSLAHNLGSLSMHGPALTSECFCSTTTTALCGLYGICTWSMCAKALHSLQNSTATTAPEAGCRVSHMHIINWQTEMRIMKRTKPTISYWVSHDNFVEFLHCHYPSKYSPGIFLSCLNNDLCGSVQHLEELLSMVSTQERKRVSNRAVSAEFNILCVSCWPRRQRVWGGLGLWSHWEWKKVLFPTRFYVHLRLCLHSKWSLSVFPSVFLSTEQARICGFLLYQE